jgi:hypothetical protein
MTPPVSFSDRDDCAVAPTLYQVASEKFGKAAERYRTPFTLKISQAAPGEISHDGAIPIMEFVAIVQKPIADKTGDAALLRASVGMSGRNQRSLSSGGAGRRLFPAQCRLVPS